MTLSVTAQGFLFMGLFKMIKAVIFDLDGTLVNSLADLAESTNFALKEMGFVVHETEKYKYFVGDGMKKLIERALPQDSNDDETVEKTLNIFLNHYGSHYVDKTVTYDGILSLLEKLFGKYKMAIVSNKNEEMALTVADKLLGDKFQTVCGKREGYPAKPDPTLTLKVIDELGAKPHECLFVGDSGMDMAVAKNAGCVAVGVDWGFRTVKELIVNGADYIVHTPEDIFGVIERVNSGE